MRSSGFRFMFLAAALAAVSGCAPQQQLPRNQGFANVNLTFTAEPAKVDVIVADVQKRFLALGDGGKHANVNVNSGAGFGATSGATVPVESMSLALDDARRKADEIAHHEGTKLGPIRSVSEDLVNPPTLSRALVENAPANAMNVRVSSATGTTTLRVEYSDDRGDAIVVYGIAANVNARRTPQRPTGASINVNAQGGSSATSSREVLEAYIAAFNAAMRAANVPSTDYAVSNMNYST